MTCIFSYNKKQKQSPRGVCKKGVLRNFAKSTEKHLRQSLFFSKVAGHRQLLLKKRLWRKCFSVNFAKFLRRHFLKEHLRCLPLNKIFDSVLTSENSLKNLLVTITYHLIKLRINRSIAELLSPTLDLIIL